MGSSEPIQYGHKYPNITGAYSPAAIDDAYDRANRAVGGPLICHPAHLADHIERLAKLHADHLAAVERLEEKLREAELALIAPRGSGWLDPSQGRVLKAQIAQLRDAAECALASLSVHVGGAPVEHPTITKLREALSAQTRK